MPSRLCCGYSLQGGVRAVGLSDIAMELGAIALLIVSMVPHIRILKCIRIHRCDEHYNDKLTEIGIVALDSASLLIHLTEALIIVVVLLGAQQRSVTKCKIWVRITEVLTALDSIIFVWHIILELDVMMIAFMIPDIIYKIYTCGVVESFIAEMRSYNGVPGSQRTIENAYD